MYSKANILKEQTAYVFEYEMFNEYADKQLEVFWPHNEIKVEKDKQDLLTNLTEQEYHAVTTTLKLFTKYELYVGNEYWGTVVAKKFRRPEIQRMAACFSSVELNSHAPFYDKINRELGLSTEGFYNSYTLDKTLSERMHFIEELVNSENLLLSLAGFSMIEGAVLYSSFAFLKHFQSNGKNKIPNIVRGINFSVRDENLHALAGAELFRILKEESKLSAEDNVWLENVVYSLAEQVYQHEERIAEMLFEKGPIENISLEDLKEFVKSRVNLCVMNLGYKAIYEVTNTTIADWFYTGINNYVMNDFFQGIGREYKRGWNSLGFKW